MQAAANTASSSTTDTAVPAGGAPAGASKMTPVPADGGEATLSPENTKIEFVGLHTDPAKPDPRRGGFEKFSGKLALDGEALKSISFEIAADSLWSEASKLTTHLKSPDFFDTKENPDIKFESTAVEAKEGATATVTGNLTLHGVTKAITVPVTVSVTKEGVTLAADFKIDRTEFGMSFEPDKIDKAVSLTVIVGEKNDPKPGA